MDTSTPGGMVPLGPDAASIATRAILFVLIMVLAYAAASGVWHLLRGGGLGGLTRRLLGRRPASPWATGEWACGQCHSVNRAATDVCVRCRAPRRATEMTFAGISTEPDIIPLSIPAGSSATVVLEHNPAAHLDGLNGHWRLRVNSVIVASAARRDGALAMLRAVDGADAVLFDPNGSGYSPYAMAALIAAFEKPKLPLSAPCPEGRR